MHQTWNLYRNPSQSVDGAQELPEGELGSIAAGLLEQGVLYSLGILHLSLASSLYPLPMDYICVNAIGSMSWCSSYKTTIK